MKTLKLLLFIFISLYLSMAFLLYFFQSKILYHPNPYPINHIEKFESITLTNNNIDIDIIKYNSGNNKAILFFPGNSSNAFYSALRFKVYKLLSNYDIYIMSYRGYGPSKGVPTEAALYSDAEMLFNYVSLKYQDISIIGRSLGTGIALDLASRHTVKKIALLTPYDSIENVAKSIYFIFPVQYLIKEKYNAISKVPLIDKNTNILILSSKNDFIIPRSNSKALEESFSTFTSINTFLIKNSSHSRIMRNKETILRLKDFFKVI